MADKDSRSGTGYFDKLILEWVDGVHHPHDAGLEGAFAAPEIHGMPAIQVGRAEGALLAMLLRLAHAKKVVEVGTLAGYSTIHLARAVGPEGHVWSVEYDPKHAAVARDVLRSAGVGDRVTVVEGAGVDMLPTLEEHGPFDAVFIDADKVNYERYGRWAARNLRPGGLLIGDNVFLFGRLLGDGDDAVAMRRFHEDAREGFDTVCIPTPDGLLVGVKRFPPA
jgi:caffeoyl-CoA O-methyltransferase